MTLFSVRAVRALAVTAVAAVAMAVAGCAALRPLTPAAAPSLYQRLGGYDAIAAVTDDFLGRALPDPRIAPFFKGLEPKDLQRVRQHLVDQLCNATGGPCYYPGKDMKTAHQELEITNDVWNQFTGHLNETMTRFKIADRERNELVVIVGSLKSSIVNH